MRLFSFRHTWRVPHDPDRVYEVLADSDRYPEWWPQVRRVVRIDAVSGLTYVRSFLPYTLEILLTEQVRDPAERHLRVSLGRDLDGWSEWRIRASDEVDRPGTVADYTQECYLTARLPGRDLPVAHTVMRANHTWMMRSGERGLRRYLDA